MSINPDEGVLASIADLDDVAQARLLTDFLPTRQLEFSTNVEQGEREETERRMPFDGYVTQIFLGVPPGVNSQVGIGIDSESQNDRVFPANPEDDFFAFDGISRAFDLTFPAQEKDKITAVFDSRANSPHFINAVVRVVDTRVIEEVL